MTSTDMQPRTAADQFQATSDAHCAAAILQTRTDDPRSADMDDLGNNVFGGDEEPDCAEYLAQCRWHRENMGSGISTGSQPRFPGLKFPTGKQPVAEDELPLRC